jgi:hypothetical protein
MELERYKALKLEVSSLGQHNSLRAHWSDGWRFEWVTRHRRRHHSRSSVGTACQSYPARSTRHDSYPPYRTVWAAGSADLLPERLRRPQDCGDSRRRIFFRSLFRSKNRNKCSKCFIGENLWSGAALDRVKNARQQIGASGSSDKRPDRRHAAARLPLSQGKGYKAAKDYENSP